ncbi:unnamed protein product [Euphydryas editha]|uniref:Uncharacterized protein n=1 Tax=Euphydryas editha TaxID=104508 RepID=A0AAU9VCU4_EUPED|nr:unnamed protein product [Euphydryas editha]
MENSKGESTPPWGTPAVRSNQSDATSLVFTHYWRPKRSTELKALLKSRSTIGMSLVLSIAPRISSVIFSSAPTVLCEERKLD